MKLVFCPIACHLCLELPFVVYSILKQCWSVGYVSLLTHYFICIWIWIYFKRFKRKDIWLNITVPNQPSITYKIFCSGFLVPLERTCDTQICWWAFSVITYVDNLDLSQPGLEPRIPKCEATVLPIEPPQRYLNHFQLLVYMISHLNQYYFIFHGQKTYVPK